MQRICGYARLQGSGDPVATATVEVFGAGTLIASTIYADAAGLALKANPFTTDAYGFFYFYAANGRYDVQFSGGTIPVAFAWGDIRTLDIDDDIAILGTLAVAGDAAFASDVDVAGDLAVVGDATVGGDTAVAGVQVTSDGTEAAPAYAHASEPGSGSWWSVALSALVWSIAGVKRLWLDNNNLYVDADVVPNAVQGYALGKSAARFLTAVINTITVGTLGAEADITCMLGSPEGVLAKPVGSICLNAAGGAGTSIYVKETGAATVNGWVGK